METPANDLRNEAVSFVVNLRARVIDFMPNLLAAIAILVLGWIVATVVAFGVRGLLKRTQLDSRLATWIMGQRPGERPPQTERWVAAAVYWIILAFVLVAVLNALQLQAVSDPLNKFLGEIFAYLPRLGGALVLLGVGWAVATVARLAVIQGLRRFNLDERLAQALQPEAAAEGTAAKPEGGAEVAPFLLNEALGDALYWLIFLFFLSLILDTLNLRGPLQPVQNLLDQILSMVLRILGALIIGVLGWLLARIVRGIVSNLLVAAGANRLGARFGIPQLDQTVGTVAYVLVLIPAVIAALKALEIRAISDPAVAMLEQVLRAIPRIAGSALILAVFYWLGQFLAGLVTQLLQAIGFDRLAAGLGLPSAPAPEAPAAEGDPSTLVKRRTPSEIAGLVVWVGVVLFGAVPAVELLQFAALTDIVEGLLVISGRVLIGALVFGIGLYLSNLAHSMIKSLGNPSSGVLAQAARVAILVFVGAMALQQMGVATDIVVLAFGLVLGAIAVAVALAFGLGGRDVAAEQIRQWLKRE
ncbi:mechanosensitive ion channel [Synechococcus sp. WC10meta]|uniref:mechanosensitive ion channel n=1 Tax=Synechococcus sp. WC10meta TaxID=2964537 RepID=UPI0039C35F25